MGLISIYLNKAKQEKDCTHNANLEIKKNKLPTQREMYIPSEVELSNFIWLKNALTVYTEETKY